MPQRSAELFRRRDHTPPNRKDRQSLRWGHPSQPADHSPALSKQRRLRAVCYHCGPVPGFSKDWYTASFPEPAQRYVIRPLQRNSSNLRARGGSLPPFLPGLHGKFPPSNANLLSNWLVPPNRRFCGQVGEPALFGPVAPDDIPSAPRR